MKNRIIIPLILFLNIVSFLNAAKVDKVFKNNYGCSTCPDNFDMKVQDDVLVLTSKYDHDLYIEISPDHELYINGEHISLNRYQQRLVGKYYDNFRELLERAKEIGMEGAKIGFKGVKIGLLAAKGVMKMLLSDYNHEDFEREIEEESEELDMRSEELEERADELEQLADEFEELHDMIRSEIDDLNDLDWF